MNGRCGNSSARAGADPVVLARKGTRRTKNDSLLDQKRSGGVLKCHLDGLLATVRAPGRPSSEECVRGAAGGRLGRSSSTQVEAENATSAGIFAVASSGHLHEQAFDSAMKPGRCGRRIRNLRTQKTRLGLAGYRPVAVQMTKVMGNRRAAASSHPMLAIGLFPARCCHSGRRIGL